MPQLFAVLTVIFGLIWAVPVNAHTLELEQVTCTGGASTAEDALTIPRDQLVCEGKRFDRTEKFVRTSSQLQERYLPPRAGVVLQAVGAAFDSMLVRFNYEDGTHRLVDVDRQMPARNWFAGNRFNVPVPVHSAPLASIDTVVERPESRATIRRFRLIQADHMAEEHLIRGLIYAMVLGLLVIPVIYDILFYRVLRQGFVLWHLAMAASMAIYALTHSGLIFLLLPNLDLGVRWWAMVLSFIVAVSSAIMVVSGLLEKRVLSRRLDLSLIAAAAIPPIAALVVLIGGEALRITGNQIILLSFIPAACLLLGALLIAIAKGSRGANWALLGLGGLIVVGTFRLLQGLEVYTMPLAIEDIIAFAMILLAIFTAFGVGDRFLTLRRERDRAQIEAIRLGQMANTDGLTGLSNRRAFDTVGELRDGQGLLVADIDNFKQINDTHGHQVGDAVLCHLASVLRGTFDERPAAQVFRLGGEEFAVIARTGSREELHSLAEQIRKNVSSFDHMTANFELPSVTVSIGAALGHGQPMREAFADADTALYKAKESGRNRTVVYSHDRDREGRERKMRYQRLGES